MDEATAHAAHTQGKPYTVLFGDFYRPKVAIEVNKETNFIGVNFFDDFLRIVLSYSFVELDEKTLFLSMANYSEYISHSEDKAMSKSTIFYFNKSGSVSVTMTDHITKTTQEGTDSFDASGNYEAYPEFGHYEALLKTER
ncbi:hypothetical protein ACKC9G_00200 [Pokkaliibacter sp. CJK22405]